MKIILMTVCFCILFVNSVCADVVSDGLYFVCSKSEQVTEIEKVLSRNEIEAAVTLFKKHRCSILKKGVRYTYIKRNAFDPSKIALPNGSVYWGNF